MADNSSGEEPIVSVSTSGSKGVQRKNLVRSSMLIRRFSIHKRIEGGATWLGWRAGGLGLAFQYPQADRRGCNPPFAGSNRLPSEFQYPQADRRGCNKMRIARDIRSVLVSVSTSGSKGVQHCLAFDKTASFVLKVSVSTSGSKGVQHDGVYHLRIPVVPFQYPQADRRGCNT